MTVVLNLSQRMDFKGMAKLSADLDILSKGELPQALVMIGNKDVFCLGLDLEGMGTDKTVIDEMLGVFIDCLYRIQTAPYPTIALVEGQVLGGGLGLAAACDVVLAKPAAVFGLPEALFGLLPTTIMPILAQRISLHQLRLMTITGASIPAKQACQFGLVDEVTDDNLEKVAHRHLRLMKRTHSVAIGRMKQIIMERYRVFEDMAAGAEITAALLADPALHKAVQRFKQTGIAPWENL